MKLNEEQQQAVFAINGRILVLAGAGSGKTRVIIARIEYMVRQKNICPSSILGLTFTNKAAKEMQSRLKKKLGQEANQVLLTTFHSFCVRILRQEIEHLGYTKKFSLYDEKDMQRMIKSLAKDVVDEEKESLSLFVQEVVKLRTKGDVTSKDPRIAQTLERLSTAMRAYNAVDFDHLLSLTCTLFQDHPQVLEKYQNQFRYICVDEYQDTNPMQSLLLELLAKKHGNLLVVGDDDQAIYGFRGADVQNILAFHADKTIKLEKNYRSIPSILEAANNLIANNKKRHLKRLRCGTKNNTSKVSIFHAPSEEQEAKAIVERLLFLIVNRGWKFQDIAILYRSNVLARTVEKVLLSTSHWQEGSLVQGIPYEVFGGLSFSERAEIKDVSAYLKILVNPLDQEALLRIINVPRKGISEKTLDQLTTIARNDNVSLYSLLETIEQHPVTKKAKTAIRFFIELVQETKNRLQPGSYSKVIRQFLEEISYKTAIEEDVKSEKMRRFKWENVEAFLTSLQDFEEEFPDAFLEDFVSSSCLTKVPLQKRKEQNTVKLMTFHSAKGLEFKACFILGLEEGIVPHEKSVAAVYENENSGLTTTKDNEEAERRVFYVAMTRAEEYLCLSMAQKRNKFGKSIATTPSRFLFEIPKSCLNIEFFRT